MPKVKLRKTGNIISDKFNNATLPKKKKISKKMEVP